MSSTYRLLCLSHDPALEFLDGDDYQSGGGGLERIEALAISRDPERMQGHENCDLLIGRYSYPLIEVGCPGGSSSSKCLHGSKVKWQDKYWLRLVHAVYRAWDVMPGTPSGPGGEAFVPITTAMNDVRRVSPCWTPERLARIAHLLKQ